MRQEQIDELMQYMDEYDMTHEQKLQFMQAVWDSVQIAMDRYFEKVELKKAISLHPRNND